MVVNGNHDVGPVSGSPRCRNRKQLSADPHLAFSTSESTLAVNTCWHGFKICGYGRVRYRDKKVQGTTQQKQDGIWNHFSNILY
ncbi:hypothetical protein DPMN_079365 [Dreissena polymorpha]|uniref:Uncharacterized protein n=1 Tax=Dreissena polymorpha TaxID=45954 RepID=A0A9D3YNY1_DREPO|nr:hypothetical protein DPMN_079365 [Dreissena polymorpha]